MRASGAIGSLDARRSCPRSIARQPRYWQHCVPARARRRTQNTPRMSQLLSRVRLRGILAMPAGSRPPGSAPPRRWRAARVPNNRRRRCSRRCSRHWGRPRLELLRQRLDWSLSRAGGRRSPSLPSPRATFALSSLENRRDHAAAIGLGKSTPESPTRPRRRAPARFAGGNIAAVLERMVVCHRSSQRARRTVDALGYLEPARAAAIVTFHAAHAPTPAITRSPTCQSVTPSPSAAMVPGNIAAGRENGRGGLK